MFIIYSKPNCTFCVRSKTLITSKGYDYVEIELDQGQPKNSDTNYVSVNEFKIILPDARTMPQIFHRFIGKTASPCKQYIGGYEDLKLYIDKLWLDPKPKQ